MRHTWTVKYSGKFDILIFSFTAILLFYIYFVFTTYKNEDVNFREAFLLLPLVLLPITISLIITPFSLLRKKKMIKTLTIDDESHNIYFTFFKNQKPYILTFNDASYQKIERKFFSVLVFYEKRKATRGHILYFELYSLFSMQISTSWKTKQIKEISSMLQKLNIEEYLPVKQKNIIDYIFK